MFHDLLQPIKCVLDLQVNLGLQDMVLKVSSNPKNFGLDSKIRSKACSEVESKVYSVECFLSSYSLCSMFLTFWPIWGLDYCPNWLSITQNLVLDNNKKPLLTSMYLPFCTWLGGGRRHQKKQGRWCLIEKSFQHLRLPLKCARLANFGGVQTKTLASVPFWLWASITDQPLSQTCVFQSKEKGVKVIK